MSTSNAPLTTIGSDFGPQLPLALGGSWFVPFAQRSAIDAQLIDAIRSAFENGVTHFDTAGGYGNGHSEEIFGQFLADKRDKVFLASKAEISDGSQAAMAAEIDASLRRLKTDYIDLFYIHWPRRGVDMRPWMEALESARGQGKIRAVGVSNFDVDEMRQVQEVGRIDAHQLGYNLLWRYPEEVLIPFCIEHGIAVLTYSSLAHGILTGKFERDHALPVDDQRQGFLHFRPDIWPHVFDGVEKLKAIAAELERPLMHLAARWSMAQPGITAVVVGARNREQASANSKAVLGPIEPAVFERMTAISDEIVRHMPNTGNIYDRHL